MQIYRWFSDEKFEQEPVVFVNENYRPRSKVILRTKTGVVATATRKTDVSHCAFT